MHVLVNGIRRALVPLGFVDLLLGGQKLDELVETPVQEAPAALDVADQVYGPYWRLHRCVECPS